MDHRSGDADMAEATPANHPTSGGEDGVVWDFLTLARRFISQGQPTQALQAVVMAMRSRGGDEAVFQSLHRARELYRTRLEENVGVDQLASLFAECAIAEAQPQRTEPQPRSVGPEEWAPRPEGQGTTSILAESGRLQIVLDASSDGSSFICLQCGGLVSSQRRDEHFAYWCCQI